jgi:hypothetical protein
VNRSDISRMGRSRRLAAIGLLVCGGALGIASSVAHGSAAGRPQARAATIESLNSTLSMAVSKIEGNTIIAQGQAIRSLSGQIDGVASLYMTLLNGARAKVAVTIVNAVKGSRGTLRGAGSGNYHVSGAVSYFTGGVTSLSGTETFAHVKNLGIHVVGTLNRRTYRFSGTIKGKLSR